MVAYASAGCNPSSVTVALKVIIGRQRAELILGLIASYELTSDTHKCSGPRSALRLCAVVSPVVILFNQ